MINNSTINTQAKIYLFDLDNSAREHGFKQNEDWKLTKATIEEKAEIEKKYLLTVSTKVLPDVLPELFNIIQARLNTSKGNSTTAAETNNPFDKDQTYLVAFNPDRLKH
ncbi:hypothetical protein LJ707_20075 [Mucilaginibacter sp. UR6-1]|uniref:hypothetical protein n=1 Tax=Mucilaginibacter sp. UR6-1 TaxID=1435643 RepID=UPI001E2A12E0|nr:hypothetical protein [Mucilaginibacter sp. UR6-1]MCC8411249.1 hypothetical protein [Mucilaginibacter sp. UR6-1]